MRRVRIAVSCMKPEVLRTQRTCHFADANATVVAASLCVLLPIRLTSIPGCPDLVSPCEQKGDHAVCTNIKVPEGTLVLQGSCLALCCFISLLKQGLVVQTIGGRELVVKEKLSGWLSIVGPEGPLH